MKSFYLMMCAALLLSACGTAREQLGLNRSAPDEFAVMSRAPLSLPPDYALRPPVGPDERLATGGDADTAATARRIVLGQSTPEADTPDSTGAQILLEQAGATAQPAIDIRATLDKESSVIESQDTTLAEKLLFWAEGEDAFLSDLDALDADTEAKRLNEAGINAPKPVPLGEDTAPSKNDTK